MPAPLLATKLYIPPPRPQVVRRPRLVGRLQAGLQRTPGVTLISAPAGFGKTTLLSDWIATLSPAPRAAGAWKVGWLSLDEGDNDLTRFLIYLIAAARTAAPSAGEAALATLHAPQSQPPAEVLLTALLNDLAARGDLVLVLDDCHVIESPPVGEALSFIAEHLPPQLRLVLASREDPAIPLARLRVRGQLTELRAADLRFTPEEAAAFLNDAMGLRLAPADISALETRTEGWIAGLQLAALSMEGRPDTAGFIRAFTGSHRFVLDYLMEEVLARQPEPVRRFLLQTSILDRLCGPLCDAVTGLTGGRNLLQTLERSNLFVVPLDDRRQCYRYHHLFADALEAQLIDEQAGRVPDLHGRASRWCEQNDLPAEAIQHALLASDWQRAAGLLERAWLAMDLAYQSAPWLRWIQQLPDELIRVRPVLCLGYAWALLNGGELEASESWLRAAERWIGPPPEDAAQMVVVDQATYRALPAAIASARAYRALALGDIPDTIAHAHRALTLAAEDDVIRRSQATGLLGLAAYANGDLAAAEQSLLAFQATAWQGGDITNALGITFILAHIWLAQGRLRDAVSAYREALHHAEHQGALPIGAPDLYRGLSELLCEQGDLETAAQYLKTAQQVGEQAALTGWPHRLAVAQARLLAAHGDLSGALSLFEEAERQYVRNPLPDQPLAALKARVWIRQDQVSAASAWARAQHLSPADDLNYVREFEYLTLARVLIARYRNGRDAGALRDAQRLLDRLQGAAEAGGRAGSMIEIQMLQALVRYAQGNTASASAALARALELAEPEGYVRIFVDEGLPIAQLLARLQVEGARQRDYIHNLLAACGPYNSVHPSSPILQTLVEPLSERELDVLKLLGTELSGPEIAAQLSVSLNTLRTHTKNIYGKLGANSRRAAVRRGQELGLLPAPPSPA